MAWLTEEQDRTNGTTRRRVLRGLVAGGMAAVAAPLVAACGGATTTGGASVAKPASGEVSKPAAAAPATSAVTVEMTDASQYVPASITIKKGTTVTWKNTGTMIHNVQTDPTGAIDKNNAVVPAGAKTFASPMLEAGKTWSTTFDVVGQYSYFCLPHQALGMVGKITVTD